tara:strand:+ start:898 stop:1413 length:516 start_codon:yes stop_codon:yes gene_type:complete
MKTNIKFGGFYGSEHSDSIDSRIEMYEHEGYINTWEDIDYQETYKSYIDNYCSELSDFILDEFKIDIDFENLSLNSPRFYNFETDTIDCEVNKDKVEKLNTYFLKDKDFIQYLNKRTESYSGFISFYTFEQAKHNKDNILIDYVLEYICKEIFNEVAELNDYELITKKEVA